MGLDRAFRTGASRSAPPARVSPHPLRRLTLGYDAHTHLDFPATPPDAVQRARAAGISGWCIAGADPTHWDRVVAVADATGGHVALGLHPWFAATYAGDLDTWIAALAARPLPDAYGEIGLDAGAPGYPDVQLAVARAQLALARDRDLPVVLHCVRAHGALLELLDSDGLPDAGGLLHGFIGAPGLAQQYTHRGLMVSFGTGVRQSSRTAEAFRTLDPTRRLLETDAPEGAPDPSAIVAMASFLAGADAPALLASTEANARRLFPRSTEG